MPEITIPPQIEYELSREIDAIKQLNADHQKTLSIVFAMAGVERPKAKLTLEKGKLIWEDESK